MRFHFCIVFATALVTACAGKVDYVKPTQQVAQSENVKTIGRSRESVWSSTVPALGKQFFVINNIDKASGLINISYNGDPEKYIDCGRITSYVKNARGERTYDFPAAKAQQSFEVMNPGVGLFFVDRRMSLDGRVNLVFEELSPTQTRVTVNTRYVVQRSQSVRGAADAIPQSRTDNLSFNSGAGASFPLGPDGRTSECVATGALEREILSIVR